MIAFTPFQIAIYSIKLTAGGSGLRTKVWNGSTWTLGAAKVWNGSTWT